MKEEWLFSLGVVNYYVAWCSVHCSPLFFLYLMKEKINIYFLIEFEFMYSLTIYHMSLALFAYVFFFFSLRCCYCISMETLAFLVNFDLIVSICFGSIWIECSKNRVIFIFQKIWLILTCKILTIEVIYFSGKSPFNPYFLIYFFFFQNIK